MAHAVLRLIAGVPLSGPAALVAETAGATVQPPSEDVFTPLERRMVRGVLELSRRPITAIMTRRTDVEWIDALAARDDVLAKIRASRYREFPIGRGSIDELLGVARKEEVLALCLQGGRLEIDKVMSEPVAAPASATVLDALELFKRAPLELVIVVDEHGGFEGIVTRTDLLEAIAGDLPDASDGEPPVKPLPDGGFSIDGALSLPDLQERLRLDVLPEGHYHTAAGLVLAILGRLPKAGDVVDCGGWRLHVIEMDGLTVKRLFARRAESSRDG